MAIRNPIKDYQAFLSALKVPDSLDYGLIQEAFEAALEAGANDVVSDEEFHEIETLPDDLAAVTDALEKQFGTPSASRLDWKPTVKTEINDVETAKKFLEFIDALEEDDDVQHVYHNAEIAADVMAQLEQE